MIAIAMIILFIIQVVGFYFLALLYLKVSKFNDLEKKQRQLMVEMDDSIAAYLSELKDENARLIAQLDLRDRNKQNAAQTVVNEAVDKNLVDRENKLTPIDIVSPAMPLNLALKSYKVNQKLMPEETKETVAAPVPKDARTLALDLHDAGRSIEEIAKILGKGRTEVELILKFR